MDIGDIQKLFTDDMQAVNDLIQKRLSSEVVLINQLGHYIINSGGKRLRPMLVLLSARASGYNGQLHYLLAAIIEFIHTATLLHDDVVDASELRRGEKTANSIWGNEASVLVGDFLYSRSFQMMVEVGNMKIMDILSSSTNVIAEGEVLQLLNCHEPDTTEAQYMEVIHYKTAKLFEAAMHVGAVISGQTEAIQEQMIVYGRHVGTAFQLIDDVLDYSSDAETMGKNIGDDLAEGKPTLPLIHAIRHGTPEQQEVVRYAIREGGLDCIDAVTEAIQSTGALAYTAQVAEREASKAMDALEGLPASIHCDALRALAHFSVQRRY
ncbi:MAG: octaprenyl diphosphate synthase [Pseudomonadota bacterium]